MIHKNFLGPQIRTNKNHSVKPLVLFIHLQIGIRENFSGINLLTTRFITIVTQSIITNWL